MKLSSLGGLIAAAALVALPLTAVAQDDDAPPGLASAWIFAPKTGMSAEFEAAVKEHVAKRAEAGDSRDWQMYTPAVGDKMGIYTVRYCCFDWADQDAYDEEARNNDLGAHFNETVMPYVDHMHHYLERLDMENSAWPEESDHFKLFGVTSWIWEEDASMEVDEVRKQFSQAAIEHGWGDENPWLWMNRIGGKPMLMLVSPYTDYADMAPPEQSFFEFMVEHTDMDEGDVAEMFETFGDGFESSDYTVWAHRPDLSLPRKD
ncbi:MAG: hypothetical protein AAGE85_02825 [Pseudomonadota bacterium]